MAIEDAPAATFHKSHRLLNWSIVLVCVIAAIARIAGGRGELWLDEVWSIRYVQQNAHTPIDILFNMHHDANHILNSFFVYLIGYDASEWSYRCPGIIAGILTVLLAGWGYRSGGPTSVLIATTLIGFSYLLIHFSSEFRGYSLQLLFETAAFVILCKADVSPSTRKDILFAILSILGFLAHPMFLVFFLAAQVWTWFPPLSGSTSRLASTLIFRTLIPGLFFAWLYFVALRNTTIGGGESPPYFDVVAQVLSLVVGGPFQGPARYIVAGFSLGLGAVALWVVSRESLKRACFYLSAIVVIPAILLIVYSRTDIYPRYFLTSVLFMLLLWSDFFAMVVVRYPTAGKWVALFLTIYSVANGYHASTLIRLERGHYQDAIQIIERDTKGDNATIAVDHALRHFILLDYYGGKMPLKKALQCALVSPESLHSSEWLLTHSLEYNFVPLQRLFFEGEWFQLVQHYSFPGLSGWHLCLYHKEGSDNAPSAGSEGQSEKAGQ